MANNNGDLTVGRISQHIKNIAVPASVAFICHTIFNMTDAFFAKLIHTDAQVSLAIAFPIYFVLLSVCVGFGQSLTANVANALGKKNLGKKRYDTAVFFIRQGNLLGLGYYLLLLLFLFVLVQPLIVAMQGTGNAAIWAYDYCHIILLSAPLFLYSSLANSVLHAVGDTVAMRNSHIGAVIVNFILDPILVLGWFGLPALGMTGLALATVISQLLICLYLMAHLKKIAFLQNRAWVSASPSLPHLYRMLRQSLAPTTRMFCIGAFFFIVTTALGHLDSKAVAGYGIALRIEQLFLLPTIGLEIALLSIVGQNYSANKMAKVLLSYRVAFRYGMQLMLVGGAIMIIGGYWLMRIFSADSEVVAHGQTYLMVAGLMGILYVIINASAAVLMGTLKVREVFIASIFRLIILSFVLIYLFAFVFSWGVNGVWLGIFFANLWGAWWLAKQRQKI